jgi:hypothetical protein
MCTPGIRAGPLCAAFTGATPSLALRRPLLLACFLMIDAAEVIWQSNAFFTVMAVYGQGNDAHRYGTARLLAR